MAPPSPSHTPVPCGECSLSPASPRCWGGMGTAGDSVGCWAEGPARGGMALALSPCPFFLWLHTAGLYQVDLYSQMCSLLTPPTPSPPPPSRGSLPSPEQTGVLQAGLHQHRDLFHWENCPLGVLGSGCPTPLPEMDREWWLTYGPPAWFHYSSLSPHASVSPSVKW